MTNFRFGDKITYFKRKGIYLEDISKDYEFKSQMSLIAVSSRKGYSTRRAHTSTLKKGWKRRGSGHG